MKINDIRVAIAGIIVLEIVYQTATVLTGGNIDVGTIGTGIAAMAGLAGYDTRNASSE